MRETSSRVRGRVAGWGIVVTALLLLGLGATPGTARADAPRTDGGIGDYRCDDPGAVYLGNARLIRKPCTISCDEVYRNIPEYREILDQGLTERDVRYHFLMKKASERFAKAVKAMARALGHDFVAESGTVTVVREDAAAPPDRTQDVIDRL